MGLALVCCRTLLKLTAFLVSPLAEALTTQLLFVLLSECSELLAYWHDLAIAGLVGSVYAHTAKNLDLMLRFILQFIAAHVGALLWCMFTAGVLEKLKFSMSILASQFCNDNKPIGFDCRSGRPCTLCS